MAMMVIWLYGDGDMAMMIYGYGDDGDGDIVMETW